jgi:hypothetical protein
LAEKPDDPPSATSANLYEPGAQWILEGQDSDQPEAVDKGNQSWDDFLKFVASKNAPMFNILKDWQIQKLTETILEVAKDDQCFSSAYFEDPEKYDQLSGYCRDYFQRDITLRIVENCQPSSPKDSSLDGAGQVQKAEKHPDLPTSVQDILRMFQGKIINGYPDGSAGAEGKNRVEEK